MSYYLIGLFLWIFSSNPQSTYHLADHRDTLLINDVVYFLDSISESEYNSIPDQNGLKLFDTSLIKIYDDSILIKTTIKNLVFKNDTNISESYKIYSYEGTFSEIGFIHIHGQYWESLNDLLVSQKNGDVTWLWGSPKISPDKSMIISYSADLGARYLPNGIQLFEVDSGRINKVFETEFWNWAPKEIKWENDSNIVIKKMNLDYADGYQESYDFRRMKIK